jgi:CheY-like chemotaxis protein/HPt (histidine-containing phosphotransfer) domain-containing protein
MFLAAHTIKGGAAMLRLTNIEALAHGVEDLLSSLREQRRTLDAAAADLLFQSIDRLRELVDQASADAFGAEVNSRVLSFANELRANAAGLPAAQPSTPRIAPTSHGIARALLVDDSPTVRELHRMLLEDAGFEAELCEDGASALARALAQPFDLIVSGVQNKGLSGFELAIALRANPAYRDVPIILTSADSDPALVRRAVLSGAQTLVRKGSLQDERMSHVLRGLFAPRAA